MKLKSSKNLNQIEQKMFNQFDFQQKLKHKNEIWAKKKIALMLSKHKNHITQSVCMATKKLEYFIYSH